MDVQSAETGVQLAGCPLLPVGTADVLAPLFQGVEGPSRRVCSGVAVASCFDIKLISIHIGYPIECCGPLSPMAKTIARNPFDSPESISVEEVYEVFERMF